MADDEVGTTTLHTDVQRKLFEHNASGASPDTAQLKSRIARLLQDVLGFALTSWALSTPKGKMRQPRDPAGSVGALAYPSWTGSKS